MTVESDLFAALSPLFGGRVYPDVAPSGTATPYCTYQQIGGRVINYTTNEAPDKQNGEFQIDVWAASRSQAAALARQIEDVMRASAGFVAQPLAAPIARHEPDTGLYGTIQDFGVWSDR